MAQTLALYRGQITASSGTNTTIFTNSASGIATRLRIGTVAWYSDNSAVVATATIEVLQSGSTYASLIGVFKGVNMKQGTFLPSNDIKFYSVTGGSVTSLWGVATNPVNAENLSALGSNGSGGYFIQDVIIGPSDVIRIGWNENSARSATISYLFTTITES